MVFDLAGELLFTIPQVSPPPPPQKNQYKFLSLFMAVVHFIHSYITAFAHSQTTNRLVNEAITMILPGEMGK